LKDLLQVYGNISGWLLATPSRTISLTKIGTLADPQGFPGRLLMQHKVGQPGGSNAIRLRTSPLATIRPGRYGTAAMGYTASL
jgi:hypothetical protein